MYVTATDVPTRVRFSGVFGRIVAWLGGPVTVDCNRHIASRPQLHQTHRSPGPLVHTFQKNQQILLIDLSLWPNVLLCTSLRLHYIGGNVTGHRLTAGPPAREYCTVCHLPGSSPRPKAKTFLASSPPVVLLSLHGYCNLGPARRQ